MAAPELYLLLLLFLLMSAFTFDCGGLSRNLLEQKIFNMLHAHGIILFTLCRDGITARVEIVV